MRSYVWLLPVFALAACKTNEITQNTVVEPDAAAASDAGDAGANSCAVSSLGLRAPTLNMNQGASYLGHVVPTVDAFAYATTEMLTGDGGASYRKKLSLVFASRKNACDDAVAGVVRQDEDQFTIGVSTVESTPGTIATGTYAWGTAFADGGQDPNAEAGDTGWASFAGPSCKNTPPAPPAGTPPPYGERIQILAIDATHVEGTFDAIYGQEEGKGTFNLPLCPTPPPTMNTTCCN